MTDELIYRLLKCADTARKSVQDGKPDLISDLLEEAANEIVRLRLEPERPNIWLEGGESAYRARGQD